MSLSLIPQLLPPSSFPVSFLVFVVESLVLPPGARLSMAAMTLESRDRVLSFFCLPPPHSADSSHGHLAGAQGLSNSFLLSFLPT